MKEGAGRKAAATGGVRYLLRAYGALMAARWSELLQYRASVFLWTLWSLAGPIIHLSVWSAVARARGEIAGYGMGDIAAYFLIQSVVYHFTVAWQAYEFGYLIRTGTLSARLLKPFDPSHYIVAQNVSFKLINLIWLIPIWAGMFSYFRPPIELSPGRLFAFGVALGAAALLQFLWVHCFAMLAFWTVRADALYDLTETVAFFIGGGIAPVAFLPAAVKGLAQYLPFYYVVGFPIEVGAGSIPWEQVWRGVAVTLAWAAVFFGLYRLLWRLGIRRYGAVGA